jgi:broad specificity phosphatase PhoE
LTLDRQLKETQPLPALETSQDLVTFDPEHIYCNRIERAIPTATPAREWRREALERLLRDVEGGR